MKIQAWHERRLKERPEYARAHEEISLAQWVADFVVDRRVARGMTQTELAELAETTQATISLIENGEGNPRLDTLARLLTVLETPPRAFGRVLAAAATGGTMDIFAMLEKTEKIIMEMTASPTSEFEPVSKVGAWHDTGYTDMALSAAA